MSAQWSQQWWRQSAQQAGHTVAYHSPIALLPEDERRIFVEAQAKAGRLRGPVSMAARIAIWQLVDLQTRGTGGK